MSTDTDDTQKPTDAPTFNHSPDALAAQLDDLESQVETARDKLRALDPTGPNGPLRQVRRKTKVNQAELKQLRQDVLELRSDLKDCCQAVRDLQSLQTQVLELQGRLEEVEA